MDDAFKDQFREAAKSQSGKWIENREIEVLSPSESQAVIKELTRKGEMDRAEIRAKGQELKFGVPHLFQ